LKCPECEGNIPIFDDTIEGEILTCPDCGMSFEVSKKKDGSFELISAQVEGEDWGE
jgi:alpha-aminoadipate carrier protein LysW